MGKREEKRMGKTSEDKRREDKRREEKRRRKKKEERIREDKRKKRREEKRREKGRSETKEGGKEKRYEIRLAGLVGLGGWVGKSGAWG